MGQITPKLIELRRDFHRHPELGFKETRTAGIVADHLRGLGLEVRTGVAETGVVALLAGGRPGKTVAIRADMDALPITEAQDRPHASLTPGVMHACGHDGHVAAALMAAEVLAAGKDELEGSVKFLFQPAEELAQGAERMIREGVMKDPAVDAVIGVHLWNTGPVGTVSLREGPLWASADKLEIVIKGRGGHGAVPHQTIDPIPAAAQVVMALQHLISTENPAFQPAVLTIGSFHAGTAWNVIPDTVHLQGTLRAFDMAQRDSLVERAEDIVRGICVAMRTDYEFEASFLAPPVVNNADMTELVRKVALGIVGPDKVVVAEQSAMGDDQAYFQAEVPGCYILVGSGNPERGLDRPHHHPGFDFDEAALPIAVEMLASTAVEYLSRGAPLV